MFAAAELAEVPTLELMNAAADLNDGTADTETGRRVLKLFQAVGGAALTA